MRYLLTAGLLLSLAACSPQSEKTSDATASKPITPETTTAPAGNYVLDKSHASLLFKVNHLGFSNYTAQFKRFDANVHFEPGNPTASSVSATVDATSIETNFPHPETLDFNAQLRGKEFLETDKYPEMTFRSTAIELTGPNTANITGDLTLHGVTKPVVLETTFNGGYPGMSMDPNARIGFSAHGTLKRSEFGMGFGVPAPGSTFGVGDEVTVILEAEFSGPPLPKAD